MLFFIYGLVGLVFEVYLGLFPLDPGLFLCWAACAYKMSPAMMTMTE